MTAIASIRRTAASATPGQIVLGGLILLFLFVFLVMPVTTVIYVAFTERGTGAFTFLNFRDFFGNDLFLRSMWNSIWVAMDCSSATTWEPRNSVPTAPRRRDSPTRASALPRTFAFYAARCAG